MSLCATPELWRSARLQVQVDIIDLGANLQAASDAARFQHFQDSNTLELESQLYALVGTELAALGTRS